MNAAGDGVVVDEGVAHPVSSLPVELGKRMAVGVLSDRPKKLLGGRLIDLKLHLAHVGSRHWPSSSSPLDGPSGVGATAATARPSAEKQAIPTPKVRTSAGIFSHRTCTS